MRQTESKKDNQAIHVSPYRTHICAELTKKTLSEKNLANVTVAGWVHRKRDHGQLLFLDLRDASGLVQCVFRQEKSLLLEKAETLTLESVIQIQGNLVLRDPETVNPTLVTGEVEVEAINLTVLSKAEPDLPIAVNNDDAYPEDTRLQYRPLDLRRTRMQRNLRLRNAVTASLRSRMQDLGFEEFQTPILAASSPEGARDYLVPSRIHPGRFYALPQAPQIFKQLLMTAGFERYFQIAPCFRDEDARADRAPGEFYQLDFEMAFASQEQVFAVLETVLGGLFQDFAPDESSVTHGAFPRLTYAEAMLMYGSDKPDLRNPLKIHDVSPLFAKSGFTAFESAISRGEVVRALPVPGLASQSRKFFDTLQDWAKTHGMPGLGYILWKDDDEKGPIAKFLSADEKEALRTNLEVSPGDGCFFICGPENKAAMIAGKLRQDIAEKLDLIEKKAFRFCFVTDYPMFERDANTGAIGFSHNPFSMPHGGIEALETKDPLALTAQQYDVVCNGIELSSGAIRNHLPEGLFKAFSIAGYPREEVEREFGGMIRAFRFGAPPHGGAAPGIDRIVMLLASEDNIREVIAFPLNGQARDPLLGAPGEISPEHLRLLGLKHLEPKA